MIRFCRSSPDHVLGDSFAGYLRSLKLRNVFNPSFHLSGSLKIFGFRAIPQDNDWIMSYILIDDGGSLSVRNISLDFFELSQGRRLIDPKIFALGDQIFATFNSGWIPEGNDLFVMRVYPDFDTPKRVLFSGRARQERNWAFFSQGDEIYALYSVAPLELLRLAGEDEQSWRMESVYHKADSHLDLSIGTPLAGGEGKFRFIGHKKLFWGRKKLYLGRYCQFDFETMTIIPGRWLIHSPKSLLGSVVKHNTNLISCTYFSGISIEGADIHLGYGVNDVDWGFSVHREEDLQ